MLKSVSKELQGIPDRRAGALAQRMRRLCCLCGCVLVFVYARASAEDLSVARTAWNGLSELRALAAEDGGVDTPARIDVSQLTAAESLLIVHPVGPLPNAELAKYLRRGGRLAVADDFGSGRAFFATFGMGLHDPGPAITTTLRDNAALPIAVPLAAHALVDGVDALVTNHPQVLFHPSLTPVFGLSRSGGNPGAIVLSGAVGSGRLIAISDSSVLINNMLQFEGNRRFAHNLLRFLRGPTLRGRVLLADSTTRWDGVMGRFKHPLEDLSALLTQLSQPRLPRLAVIVLSTALAALLLSAVATSLPRRSAYARRSYLQSAETPAGLAGRVSHYAAGTRNLIAPLTALKNELEFRAVERLSLPPEATQPQRIQVLTELRAAGYEPRLIDELSAFLTRVDRLQDGAASAQATLVTPRQFSELVAGGRRILADLEAAPHPHERHE